MGIGRAERRRASRQEAKDKERLDAWCRSHSSYTHNVHTQTTIRDDENGFEAEVDERLAPLVLQLWSHDLITISSCEDAAAWLGSRGDIDTSAFIDKFFLGFLRPADLERLATLTGQAVLPTRVGETVTSERGWDMRLADMSNAEPARIPGVIGESFIPWDDYEYLMRRL
jgi:hypothetical protein